MRARTRKAKSSTQNGVMPAQASPAFKSPAYTTDQSSKPNPIHTGTGSGGEFNFGNIPVLSPAAPAYSTSQSLGGFAPGTSEDKDVGGRTVGEFVGDVARPIGTAVGNVVGGIAGAVAGNSISSTTTSPATWNNHSHFRWEVGFTTSGRNGWIVQDLTNTRRAQNAAGNDLPDGLTPRYWEAWSVDGAGNVTPASGTTNDTWQRKSWGNNTQGHWSMSSKVYFTTTDPATQGFAVGNVPEAGGLMSTTTAPAGLGIARLHRYAQGSWDSTGAVPTHTGSAGPL